MIALANQLEGLEARLIQKGNSIRDIQAIRTEPLKRLWRILTAETESE